MERKNDPRIKCQKFEPFFRNWPLKVSEFMINGTGQSEAIFEFDVLSGKDLNMKIKEVNVQNVFFPYFHRCLSLKVSDFLHVGRTQFWK